jgi:hypothetical protein
MVEYLWDAEADVVRYTDTDLVINYSEKGDVLTSRITINNNLEVEVETNLDF